MSRYEYLKTLESHLRLSLSRNEINDILRDYGEYFTEGENQGKSEWEIIAKLGDPKEVAQQIISESRNGQVKSPFEAFIQHAASTAKSVAASVGGFIKTSSGKITIVLLALLSSPLWAGAFVAIIGVLLTLFGTLICLIVMCCGVILFAIATAVTTGLVISFIPLSATFLLFIFSIGLIAGGVLGLSLLLIISKWCWNKLTEIHKYICNQHFFSKETTPPSRPTLEQIKKEEETENA